MAQVIGGPLNLVATGQLELRNKKYKKKSERTSQDLAYLNSKTGWAKLTSGVNIQGSENKAKEFILIGGTLGRFGDKAYSTYEGKGGKGFRPMPGITGVQVRYISRFGIFKEASVTFNCWDVDQITDIELLFMRPGFSVLLEWGHSLYFTSEASLITVPSTVSQMFTRTQKVDNKDKTFYAGSKESINNEIEKLKLESKYNYDGMLGLVKNFSWSFRPDGGYDCSTTIISMGDLIQSITIDTDTPANTTDKNSTNTTTPAITQAATMIETVYKGIADNLPTGNTYIKNTYPEFYDKYVAVNGSYDLTYVYYGLLYETQTARAGAFSIGMRYTYGPQLPEIAGNQFNIIWMTLKRVCSIINAALLVDENSNNIIKLNTKKDRAKFRTFADHVSSDPRICMIVTPSVDSWHSGLGNAQQTLTLLRDQIDGDADDILNIFVNIEVVVQVLDTLRNQPKESRTLNNLMRPILEKLTEALGNVNEFDLHYEETELTYYIVDRKVKPDKSSIPTLKVTGLESTVTKFDLVTKLSPSITTMLAITAQSTIADIGLEAEAFLAWNKGLKDRIISQRKQKVGEADQEEITTARTKAQEQRQAKVNNAIFNIWNYNSYSIEEVSTARSNYSQYATTYIQFYEGGTPAGIIPFEVQIEMEGISGMKIGEVFKINTDIMPNYYNGVVGFIVTGVDHDIKENKWTTTIKAQTVIIGEGKAKKAAPVKEERGLGNNRQNRRNNTPSRQLDLTGEGLDPLIALIVAGESGGDYESIFGKPFFSGAYERETGKKMVESTIQEVYEKTKGSYIYGYKADGTEKKVTTRATGKFQILGNSLVKIAGDTGIPTTALYNEENQEKMGRYFILSSRKKLANYVTGVNSGTKSDLERAVTDLGQCWTSKPTIKNNKGEIIGNVELDGDASGRQGWATEGVNSRRKEFNVSQVVRVLIKTRIQYSNNPPEYRPAYANGTL